jgi:hypothetical protein
MAKQYGSLAEAKAALSKGELTNEEFVSRLDEFMALDAKARKEDTRTVTVKKTKCEISREFFAKHAPGKDLNITVGDGEMVSATRKEFNSGGFGWNINDKVTVTLAGVKIPCQFAGNLIIIGSKDAPDKGNPPGYVEIEPETEGANNPELA